MGYPVVTLSRDNHVKTTLHAQQEYFRLDNTLPLSTKYPSDYGYEQIENVTQRYNYVSLILYSLRGTLLIHK